MAATSKSRKRRCEFKPKFRSQAIHLTRMNCGRCTWAVTGHGSKPSRIAILPVDFPGRPMIADDEFLLAFLLLCHRMFADHCER